MQSVCVYMYIYIYICSSCVGQVVSTLAFGADNPGSIPGGGAEKENLFPCCFPVLRRAL